jgi:hypothetical protein
MDMYLTAIGYAMLPTKPDSPRPASAADEDAYYAQVGAPMMDPWVGHVVAWIKASLATAHSHTPPAAVRQPVRHA